MQKVKKAGDSVPKMAGSLSLFSDDDCEKLSLVKKALDQCLQLAASQVEKPEDFFKILKDLQQNIEQLNFEKC